MTPRYTEDGAASKIASLGLACMLLLEPAGAMAQQAARQACAADIEQLCPQVKPGEGRLKASVKEHFGQLTACCQTAPISNVTITKAWQTRRQRKHARTFNPAADVSRPA